MATNILMPALSPTMTEGKLAKWHKAEGDKIVAGDVIAEIETDKATMEVEAVDEGVLGRILVPEGTEAVKVNEPIAVLVDEGEAVPAAGAPAAAPAPVVAEVVAPVPVAAPVVAPKPVAASPGRIFASPLARRIAKDAGIALESVTGSGPNGRIVRADVEKAKLAPKPAAAPRAATPAPVAHVAGGVTKLPNSTMRRTIARRLTEAKQTIPHFYLTIDIEIDALLKLRGDLNKRAPEGEGAFKLSVNDFIIKASAVALRRMPLVNASYTEEAIILYDDVDVSIAVAIPDGLITPIVRQADRKSLAVISNEMKELAGRAKAGKLKLDEFQGGGFSISNLGMYGIREFSAVINPPQGAILAVGAGEPRAVVRDGALAVATVMTCTLSCDHRVVDGALGAEFLALFKTLMEDPLILLM